MSEPKRIDPVGVSPPPRKKRKQLVRTTRKPLVLIVEDDPEMRDLIASGLRRMEYEVVEAADGDQALTWLGPGVLEGNLERIPSVIVSDVRLPFYSGLEILEGLQLASVHVPVILITGFGDEELHAAARLLGAERVLDKPFEVKVLLAAVSSAVYRNRTRWQSERGPGGGDDA